MITLSGDNIKVADQVWIALALLTRENPTRYGFRAAEIGERVRSEFGNVSPGVPTHISTQCVATKPVNPAQIRMITKHGSLNALYREGDPCHPDRLGGKILPREQDLPSRYHDLLAWYRNSYAGQMKTFGPNAGLLRYTPAVGSGERDIAARHDEYLALPEHVRLYPMNEGSPYMVYAAEERKPYGRQARKRSRKVQ